MGWIHSSEPRTEELVVSRVSRLVRSAARALSALMYDGSMDSVYRNRFQAGRNGRPRQCMCMCGTDANGER